MELLVISLLGALAIVQGIKLYVQNKLLHLQKTACSAAMEAFGGIADGKFKVVRLDEKTVKVVPND